MELNERKRKILKAIIKDYIKTAEPVSSKNIAEKWDLIYSPATIRNEMSELEDLGYLEKPHTSAGRIPSYNGYRLYVDELMNLYRLSASEIETVNKALNIKIKELDHLIFEASRIISDLTEQTSVTMQSHIECAKLRKLDIIPLDFSTFVLVAVLSNGTVKNKLVKVMGTLDEDETANLTRVFNTNFKNQPLHEITFEKVPDIYKNISLLGPLIDFINELSHEKEDRDVYIGGVSRLLRNPEYRNVEKAEKLLDFLSDRNKLFNFDIDGHAEEVKIVIGPENGFEPLNDASIIYATYKIGEDVRGIVGIIGPTRMDYARIAARLKFFTTGLNKFLIKNFPDCF